MSSSEDDMPLARSSGNRRVSSPKISKAADREMDRLVDSSKAVNAGIPVRNGPVFEDVNTDSPATNGKRRSHSSVTEDKYKGDSSDDEPLAKRQKTNGVKTNGARKEDHDSSDDEPIAGKQNGRVILPPSYEETFLPQDSSDDNEPLGTKLSKQKAAIEKQAVIDAKKIRADEAKAKKAAAAKDESSDDEPIAKTSMRKRQANGNGAAVTNRKSKVAEDSDSDVPLAKARAKKRKVAADDSDSDAPVVKAASKKKAIPASMASKTKDTKAKDVKAKDVEAKDAKIAKKPAKGSKAVAKDDSEEPEEEDAEFEWWNQPKKEDDSIKWTKLEHNGVLFPPPYQRLPAHVRLIYDGTPVVLSDEAEEVAWFFGSMLHSKLNVENPTFQKNFFADFKDTLKSGGAKDESGNKVVIKDFSKLDFTEMHNHFMTTNEARKARSSAEKKAETEAKKAIEAPYKFCMWDGRKQQVGNFRVEPPGLFRGRGEHPKTGMVKRRVMPEQITINIGKDAKVPEPPEGHKWKAVQHDNKATWLAMWQENVNNQYKYVMLAANSDVKGQSDFKKFEKARELKKYIDEIRRDYTRELKSELMADRQRATAMYLIDKLALRAGNEKDTENEAETVGCCSLKYEHITLKLPNIVVFDFLGKDSIRYHDEVAVDPQVFKNLKLFKKAPKKEGDDIFDRLNTSQLNKHLSSYMPGLTAKVFRTYNASYTMSQALKALKNDNRSVAEKVALYNDCNRRVAILCNHKRTVGENHTVSMKKLKEKLNGIKYQRWRHKQMILDVDPKQAKKKGVAYFALDEGLDEAWIVEHQLLLVEQQQQAITKKFEKENEKLVAEGGKPQPQSELKTRLKAADELAAKYKKENKTKKVEAEGKAPSVEKIEAAISRLDKKIHETELAMQSRESNKEVALGTSKINYIDPRLTVVFSKKFNVPIERLFAATMRAKFNWAIKSVENEDWEF